MFLSKLQLNPYNRMARNDLNSPYNLHRTLMRGFPEGEPEKNRMLFRAEARAGMPTDASIVLVQSLVQPPDWTHLPEDYCLQIDPPKKILLDVTTGQHLAFRLVANPTVVRKVDGTVDKKGTRRKNRRYPIIDEEEQRNWLIRRSEALGFRLLYLNTAMFRLGSRFQQPSHEDKTSIPHVGVRYDGLLEVLDPSLLVYTVEQGVGRAKAFGFGLLSLARPM